MMTLQNILCRRNGFELSVESLTAESGTVTALVGPNGAGKSTLLSLMGLMTRPEQGLITLNGEPLFWTSPQQLLTARRNIAYLAQQPYVFDRTVFENVAYGLRVRRWADADIRRRVGELLTLLRLEHLASRLARQLSGGEIQRMAIARTLAVEAVLYLLDEPTANVDRENVVLVEDIIRDLARSRHAAVVLSTHGRDQAYRLSDRQVSVIDGTVHDLPYENVLEGQAVEDAAGHGVMLTPQLRIATAQPAAGSVRVAIDPEAILLSEAAVASSARNSLKGRIVQVTAEGETLQVFVEAGVRLCALITPQSYHEMNLNIGSDVWMTFKATAVRILN